MAQFPILTTDGDPIVTADSFAMVVDGGMPPSTTGTILVTDDHTSANAVIIDIATLALTRLTIETSDFGASVASGTFAVYNGSQQLFIYDASNALIASPTVFVSGLKGTHVGSDWAHTFYASRTSSPTQIRAVSDAGVLGTTWTLDVNGSLDGLTVNLADTIAYYAKTQGAIRSWDLVNNMALGVFLNLAPDYVVVFLLIQPLTGRLLVLGAPDGFTYGVAEYTPAGTLVRTVALPVDSIGDVMALDPQDTTAYWVRLFTDISEDFTSFLKVASDGTATTVVDSLPVGTGADEIPLSCPFFPTSAAGMTSTTFPIRRLRRWAP